MSVLIYFHLKILQLTPDKYVDFLQYVCSYGILSSCSVKIQLYTCDKCKAKLCVPIWYLKYLLCENLASHSKQAYAFTKTFLPIRYLKWLICANPVLHSQLNGFSTVWVRKCTFILLFFENSAPHTTHLYGFSLVWICICSFIPLLLWTFGCTPLTSVRFFFSMF